MPEPENVKHAVAGIKTHEDKTLADADVEGKAFRA